ncbi:MAPEG family protein [Phaeovulum sp.]|uniref:MAPEG family protein n=1 Tax=Phaeovulum sp. TaxID=2934796 RepID=UPI0027306B41|nr:MAPEG family protein [Phaeovulum sp.]MDP1667445.1 MAPEG family protein [Phaeovulum sp.]MDZ4119962.1 MAPEG family protein [Phaeovulum sp.]
MTPELTALALAGQLQAFQLSIAAVPANRDLGSAYTGGSRDEAPTRPLPRLSGRLIRATNNHFEGLILFTLAVVVVTLSGQSTPFTAACACTYLGTRLLYFPAYALGLNPYRSLIWSVGFFATPAMLVAAQTRPIVCIGCASNVHPLCIA